MQIQPREVVVGRSHILFDPQLACQPSLEMFDPSFYRASGQLRATQGGRGSNFFVEHSGQNWVLRHYRRGGLVGKVLHDRYLRVALHRSRPWREWLLLATLYAEGFPVPRPVAAHLQLGLMSYRADLLTEEIPNASPLAARLSGGELPREDWESVGQCIARIHARGVFHADLNAHNILVGRSGEVFLLDFDRGSVRSRGRWQERNLLRLHRSLIKLQSQRQGFAFSPTAWSALLQGYHHAMA